VRDLTEVVAAVGRLTSLPVIVDVDNAGGHVDAAHRYAHDLAQAGAAAVCLEDSAYPKCNSFSRHRRQTLADPELVVRQLDRMRRAAGQLLIIARTEALIAEAGLPVALERARAYASAGADAVLIHSQDPTGAEALRLAGTWDGGAPLVTVPTAYPQVTYAELGRAGYRMCIYANHLTRAAISAMEVTARQLGATGTFHPSVDVRLAGVGDLLRVADRDALACL
jgi:phosphoenolpyruvate phosphomutase